MRVNRKGVLYGVGVGPGDPDLITLKAVGVIKRCPVIAYPAPESGDSFTRAIVAAHLPSGQIEIPIRMPLDAARFPADAIYDQAASDIEAHLDAGQDVAAICQGDPFFYGSFMYLYGRLARRYDVTVIPGVSSLMACATTMGAPLAARMDVLTIIPAPLSAEDIARRIAVADAVAIIKLGRHFEKVCGVLSGLGLLDQARYVEHATLPTERIIALRDVDPQSVPYFSMILVHKRGTVWG
jgi:precorrin-2/cobalt-factor-2 C20-methyltransferase